MRPIEMICINCPLGCQLTVSRKADGALEVSGNNCVRGIEYAHTELENPLRRVTTTVNSGSMKVPRVSVKSSESVPVEEIFLIMERIEGFRLNRSCKCGDILIDHISGDIDLIATQDFTFSEGEVKI